MSHVLSPQEERMLQSRARLDGGDGGVAFGLDAEAVAAYARYDAEVDALFASFAGQWEERAPLQRSVDFVWSVG